MNSDTVVNENLDLNLGIAPSHSSGGQKRKSNPNGLQYQNGWNEMAIDLGAGVMLMLTFELLPNVELHIL